MTEEWTPYGLEAIRGRLLWRKRILALVLFFVLAIVVLIALALLSTPTVTTTEISLAGSGDDGTIQVDVPDAGAMLSKPIRVSLSPGGVTLVGPDGATAPGDRLSKASTDYPHIRDADPFNFLGLMFPWGLLLLLAYLMYAAGKGASNPSSEVNFGIYKGAMPLEMMTASYSHLVRTQRLASGSLFGKERADHVDTESS